MLIVINQIVMQVGVCIFAADPAAAIAASTGCGYTKIRGKCAVMNFSLAIGVHIQASSPLRGVAIEFAVGDFQLGGVAEHAASAADSGAFQDDTVQQLHLRFDYINSSGKERSIFKETAVGNR